MQLAHARSWHWLVTVPLLLQATACGGAIRDPDPFPPGLLDLELQPAAAVRFENVSYDLGRADGFARSGPVAVSLSDEQQSFSFQVDDLQPATYLLTVDADATVTADASHTHCRGRTSFSIESGKTTSVALRVQCEGVVTTGSKLGTRVNECPVIVTLRAAPSNAGVGEAVALQAEVRDDMVAAAPLSYTWSSSDGNVLGSAATTNFRCKTAGPAKVYVAVSDGDSACKPSTSSVDVLCTDARCLAAGDCATLRAAAAGSGAAGLPTRSLPTQPATSSARGGQGGIGAAGASGSAGNSAPPQAGRPAPVTPTATRSATGAAGAAPSTRPRALAGMSGGVMVQPPDHTGGAAGDTASTAVAGSGAAGMQASGGAGAESPPPIAGSIAAGGEGGTEAAAGSGGTPAGPEQGGGAGEPPRREHPDDDEDSDERERHRRRDGAAGQAGAQPEAAGAGGSTLILTSP